MALAGVLEIQLQADIARLSKDMRDAERVVGGAMSKIENAAAVAKGALIGLGAVGLAAAFMNSMKAAIDLADNLNKLSQRTGVAVESLSQLQYAAKLADVSSDTLTTGLKKLNISIAQGIAGDKEKVAMFKQLGITLTDTSGRAKTADAVLLDMADAFAKARDGAGKTAISVGLLSKAGDEMIPLLNGGSAAIRDLMKEADKLGLTIGSDFAKQAEEFNDNLTRVQTQTQKTAILFAGDFVAGLGKAMKAMADATIEGGRLVGVIAGLQVLLTGDDKYKAEKAVVEKTDEYLKLQSEIDKMRAAKVPGLVANRLALFESEAAQVKASLDLNRNYLKSLDAQEDATKAAAAKIEKARTSGKDLNAPKSGSTESEYQKLIARINEKIEAEGRELVAGRELTEVEKFHIKVLQDLEKARGKISAAEKKSIFDKLAEAEQIGNVRLEQKAEIELAMEAAKIRQKIRADEYKAGEDLAAAAVSARVEQNKSAREYLEQLQFETRLLGMTNQERELAIGLRELENKGIKEGTEAHEKYGAAIKQALLDKTAAEEHKRVWDSIDKTAHDVFTNIFEGGSSAFKKLGQTLKAAVLDLLYQMTVKKWILNFAASGSGQAVSSIVGGSAGAGGGLGSLGGIGNLLGIGGSLGAFGGGLSAGFGGLTGSIGGLFGAAGSGTTLMGALDAGAIAMGSGNIMGGLGTFAGALGPIALLAAPILSSLLKGHGETRVGGRYINGEFMQGPSGGAIGGASEAITAAIQSINATLGALGSTARLSELVSGLEQSEHGKGFAFAGGSLTTGSVFGQDYHTGHDNRRGSKTADQAMADFGEELKQATLQALQAANVPGQLGDYLRQLGDIDALSGGALDAALGRINKALSEKQQLEARIFDLTATDIEKLKKTRDAERAAIDASNLTLLERIYALQDEQAAAESARIANEAAADAARLATEAAAEAAADAARLVKDLALQHKEALLDHVESAKGALLTAYQQESGALRATIDLHRNYAKSLREFRDQMLLGEDSFLSPAARTQLAGSKYDSTIARAQAGDLEAIAALQADSTAYLEALKNSSPTRIDFVAGFARVASGLTITAAKADSAATIAQQELDVMTSQLSALGLINTNIVSFGDALRAYLSASNAAAAAGAVRLDKSLSSGVTTTSGTHLSAEFLSDTLGYFGQQNTLNDLYMSTFGRTGDAAGLAYHTAQLNAGVTYDQLAAQFQQAKLNGSHASGLDYVPFDGYRAELHQGERVKTAAAARAEDGLVAEVRMLRAEVSALVQHGYETSKAVREMRDRGVYALNSPDGEVLEVAT